MDARVCMETKGPMQYWARIPTWNEKKKILLSTTQFIVKKTYRNLIYYSYAVEFSRIIIKGA